MSYSTALDDLVSGHAGHVTPTARASYLYYDQPGNGIGPLIDTEAEERLVHGVRSARSNAMPTMASCIA